MSVIIADQESIVRIYRKCLSYKGYNFVDINYCEKIRNMSDNSISKWILKLYELNERSWYIRYRGNFEDKKIHPYQLIENELTRAAYDVYKWKNINTFQMLKSLKFLRYNIEDFNDDPAVILLNDVIAEIKNHIIGSLPEYNAAEWG